MTNVFFYSEDKEKQARLQALCKKTGLTMGRLGPADISKRVADLAGLPVSTAIPYPSGIPSKSPVVPFYRMPEILLFAGVDPKKLNRFLDSFPAQGISPVLYKAMITPYSMGWTLYELIEHLKLEAAGTKKR